MLILKILYFNIFKKNRTNTILKNIWHSNFLNNILETASVYIRRPCLASFCVNSLLYQCGCYFNDLSFMCLPASLYVSGLWERSASKVSYVWISKNNEQKEQTREAVSKCSIDIGGADKRSCNSVSSFYGSGIQISMSSFQSFEPSEEFHSVKRLSLSPAILGDHVFSLIW